MTLRTMRVLAWVVFALGAIVAITAITLFEGWKLYATLFVGALLAGLAWPIITRRSAR